MKQEKKELVIYIVLAFGIAWIFQVIACMITLKPNAGVAEASISKLLLAVVMLVPMFSVLICKKGLGNKKTGIGWKIGFKKNWRMIFVAWFLPAIFSAAGAALYFVILPDRFDSGLGYLVTLTGMELAADGTIAGMSLKVLALVQVISAVTYAPFVNMLFAAGEEIGWRGYMTPAIQKFAGKKAGLIVSNIIWGLWHAPLIVLIGYEYGTGYFGAPVTGVLGFCICTTAMGIMLSSIYQKTNSIWFPALLHGSFNAVATIPMMFAQADMKEYFLGPVPCGMIAVIPMVIFAVVLLIKMKTGDTGVKESTTLSEGTIL